MGEDEEERLEMEFGGGFGSGKQTRTRGRGGGGGGDQSQNEIVSEYYKSMLSSDPNNTLLLRNYGQFLHEVPMILRIFFFFCCEFFSTFFLNFKSEKI